MSKDQKQNNILNVETVDNSITTKYRIIYQKIYNNTLHSLYRTYKTYNAAKRFISRLKLNPNVKNIKLINLRDDIDF